MPKGGFRPNAGRRSAFPGACSPGGKAFSIEFTHEGRAELDTLAGLNRLSLADVVATLLDQYSTTIAFLSPGVVYPHKRSNVLTIRLAEGPASKLMAARERTGKSYSDVVEGLVRRHGATAAYPSVRGRGQASVQPATIDVEV